MSVTRSSVPAETGVSGSKVLTKAFLRAGGILGLKGTQLARIVGTSAASVSRMARDRHIDPESKEGELALLFLRVYRSLDALVGGHEDRARAWLDSENAAIGGIPRDLIQTASGLVHVVEYLDAMRGR